MKQYENEEKTMEVVDRPVESRKVRGEVWRKTLWSKLCELPDGKALRLTPSDFDAIGATIITRSDLSIPIHLGLLKIHMNQEAKERGIWKSVVRGSPLPHGPIRYQWASRKCDELDVWMVR